MGFLQKLFGGGEPPPPATDAAYQLIPSKGGLGRGFIVRRVTDDQRLRWKTVPKGGGLWSFNVVGERHRPKALADQRFAAGRWVSLVPEPDNPHDRNAVAVWDAQQRIQLGYVPRDEARLLVKQLGKWEPLRCLVIWESIEHRKRTGVRLLLIGPTTDLDVTMARRQVE